jgi:hypothetical protein
MHRSASTVTSNHRIGHEVRPDLVVVFPGGKGTASMLNLARLAGVGVAVFDRKGARRC